MQTLQLRRKYIGLTASPYTAVALLVSLVIFTLTATSALASNSNTYRYGCYEYGLNSDGTAFLCKYHGTDDNIVVPNEIEGHQVKELGRAYYGDIFGGRDLKSVTVPEGITSISVNAFEDASVEALDLPSSLTTITSGPYDGPFYHAKLGTVTARSFPDRLFKDCSIDLLVAPEGVTEIYGEAFENCSIKSVDLPSTLETAVWHSNPRNIGAFQYVKGLQHATLRSVPNLIFQQNESLETVVILNGSNTIGDSAFKGCTALTSISIPDSVTRIGDYAFENCRALTSVGIPSSVKSIGYYAFAGTGLETISFNEGLVKIGSCAFRNCKNLVSITLPSSLREIHDQAFYYCDSLSNVTLQEGVTYIGSSAFGGLNNLSNITLPSTIEEVGTGYGLSTSGPFSGSRTEITFAEGTKAILYGTTDDMASRPIVLHVPSSITEISLRLYDNRGTYPHRLIGPRVCMAHTYADDHRNDGARYEVDPSDDGWYDYKENRYYYRKGARLTGEQIVDSETYYFNPDADGAIVKGDFIMPDGKTAHYDSSTGAKRLFVTFNCTGGTAVTNQKVKPGERIERPTNPIRANYTFGGWYTDKSLTTKYDFDSPVKNDLTLYAKWNIAKYVVTFQTNGGSNVKAQNIAFGSKASKPANPTRTGYTFKGWYSDKGLTKAYDFSTAVKANTTLYAKWQADTYKVAFNSNGGSAVSNQSVKYGAKATKPANPTRGGYVFKGWYSDKGLTTAYGFNSAVKGDVTLYAKWAKQAAPTSFKDVPSGEWYTDWASQAAKAGLMTGMKDDVGNYTGYFEPNRGITRAEVATVLWRIAGSPSSSASVMPDVRGHWSQQAVAWCASKSIVTGYTGGAWAGTFRPDAQVSREELATMMYRFAKQSGVKTANPPKKAFNSCGDTGSVSPWARDAMTWCSAAGVITGVQGGAKPMLAPQDGATRAMAAKIFVQTEKLSSGQASPYLEEDEEEPVVNEQPAVASQVTLGQTEFGLSYAVVPEGAVDAEGNAYVLDQKYDELSGRYVGPGTYVIGYKGVSADLALPAQIEGAGVVSADLAWRGDAEANQPGPDGRTRLATLTLERGCRLVSLDASGNQLTGLGLSGDESLGCLPALRFLDLSGTQVASLDATLIPALESLALRGCPLSADALEALSAWRGATGLAADLEGVGVKGEPVDEPVNPGSQPTEPEQPVSTGQPSNSDSADNLADQPDSSFSPIGPVMPNDSSDTDDAQGTDKVIDSAGLDSAKDPLDDTVTTELDMPDSVNAESEGSLVSEQTEDEFACTPRFIPEIEDSAADSFSPGSSKSE